MSERERERERERESGKDELGSKGNEEIHRPIVDLSGSPVLTYRNNARTLLEGSKYFLMLTLRPVQPQQSLYVV